MLWKEGGDEEGRRGERGQRQLFRDGRNDATLARRGETVQREAPTRQRMENTLQWSPGLDERTEARCPGRGGVITESRGVHCGKAGSVDIGAGGRAALAVKTEGVPSIHCAVIAVESTVTS